MNKSYSLSDQNVISAWADNYKSAPQQLKKMAGVDGLISAFNANIDAVIKISGENIEGLISKYGLDESIIIDEDRRQIRSREDVVRGILHCFKSGIAEEWLVDEENVYNWLKKGLGYDKLQMGGQGGIVANVMAICGVNPVYVHCASLPSLQAELFLDRDNLIAVDDNGKLKKAHTINRSNDTPLVHWIIEFDKGDTLRIGDNVYTCPKSNRFIATYDPLNFKLHIDEYFGKAMAHKSISSEVIILSGYQMLKEVLDDGNLGSQRIDKSIKMIDYWRSGDGNQLIHLEMASTQDPVMRKYLLDTLAVKVDSLGFNERELIDLLEVMGENDLVEKCDKETNSINLFQGMIKLFKYTGAPRIQLHMFGLYLTVQKKNFKLNPVQNRNGMQLAAVIAAAKAGTGAIDKEEVLLWACNRSISKQGISELRNLSGYIDENLGANELIINGIWGNSEYDVIAVPTILIDKPVTLVGMGDTISSISLVASR